jgi:hypothetical protein
LNEFGTTGEVDTALVPTGEQPQIDTTEEQSQINTANEEHEKTE